MTRSGRGAEDECVSGSDPVGAEDELVDAAVEPGPPLSPAQLHRFAAAVGNSGPGSQVKDSDRVAEAAVVMVIAVSFTSAA